MKFMGFLLGKKAQPELKFRGFLGVELAEKDGGVEVKAVLPQSPADKAGLKPGDRITLFEGKAVSSRRKLEQLAAALAAGQSARLTLIRDGSTHKVTVKLAEGL